MLSWQYLVIYALLFILLRTSVDIVSVFKPGVLGIESSVTSQQIITDTNKDRQAEGLKPLSENAALDSAAYAKAQNMFAENYWAHFSPSGQTPWDFILNSGYKFSYAGENLAKGFYNSDDVVKAWMNSPAHRDNLLNTNYQDIGVAVVNGTLNGQQTTLVVQMFGKTYEPVAAVPQVDAGGKQATVPVTKVTQSRQAAISEAGSQVAAAMAKPVADPYQIVRIAGLSLLGFIALLTTLDFWILRRRGVFRLSTHHFAHLGFMAAAGASLLLLQAGQIL